MKKKLLYNYNKPTETVLLYILNLSSKFISWNNWSLLSNHAKDEYQFIRIAFDTDYNLLTIRACNVNVYPSD